MSEIRVFELLAPYLCTIIKGVQESRVMQFSENTSKKSNPCLALRCGLDSCRCTATYLSAPEAVTPRQVVRSEWEGVTGPGRTNSGGDIFPVDGTIGDAGGTGVLQLSTDRRQGRGWHVLLLDPAATPSTRKSSGAVYAALGADS